MRFLEKETRAGYCLFARFIQSDIQIEIRSRNRSEISDLICSRCKIRSGGREIHSANKIGRKSDFFLHFKISHIKLRFSLFCMPGHAHCPWSFEGPNFKNLKSKCHSIGLQTPIFPTPQKSYATIFLGCRGPYYGPTNTMQQKIIKKHFWALFRPPPQNALQCTTVQSNVL